MTDPKPSKSEEKRRHHALQALGERLAGLPADVRANLDLDETLSTAIDELGRIRSHEALRRQKQYIGRLMREADLDHIRDFFMQRDGEERRAKQRFSQAERWRDRLLRDGRNALPDFTAETAADPSVVAAVLDELAVARTDAEERGLRRRLFRAVHDALAARTQGG